MSVLPISEFGEEMMAQDMDWRPVDLEGIKDGYIVSRFGEVKNPEGRAVKAGSMGGKSFWVQLVLADNKQKRRAIRVDKLVMWSFLGEYWDESPVHIDGDLSNCSLSNLCWAGELSREDTPPPPKTRRKGRAKASPADDIEVLRVYRAGKLQFEIDQDGNAKLPKLHYTATELASLVALGQRAVEMNNLMDLN